MKTKRAADQTTLTISLPKELKAAIEEAANTEHRSTSNYLVVELAKLVGKQQEITHSPTKPKREARKK